MTQKLSLIERLVSLTGRFGRARNGVNREVSVRVASVLPADVRRRLARQILWTKWSLIIERISNALWPGIAPLVAFLVLSVFGVWSVLPDWARWPLGGGLLVLGGAWLVRALLRVSWPSRADAVARLDVDTVRRDGASQPLSSFEDALAVPPDYLPSADKKSNQSDAGTAALWALHKKRLADQVAALHVPLPRGDIAGRDPYAIRVALVLALGIGVFLSWGQARPMLGISGFLSGGDADTTSVVAWVVPPDYTRMPPLYLTETDHPVARSSVVEHDGVPTYRVPQGSVFFARVGHSSAPKMKEVLLEPGTASLWGRLKTWFRPVHGAAKGGTAGAESVPAFAEVEPGQYEVSAPIDQAVRIDIKTGFTSAGRWAFRTIADQKPAIGFSDDISVSAQSALQVSYAVFDDYGVTAASAVVRRGDIPEAEQLPLSDRPSDVPAAAADGAEADARLTGDASQPFSSQSDAAYDNNWFDSERAALDRWLKAPLVLDLGLKTLRAKRGNGTFTDDLTAHPWAGLDVLVQLRAEDDLGQVGVSEVRPIVLPERPFRNPLARAVIEQRKYLALHPEETDKVARMLEALIAYPDVYAPEVPIYLGLHVAALKLSEIGSFAEFRAAHKMLWDVAVDIEDGGRERMAERMRELQKQLSDAIEQGRPQDEIDQIMQALQNMIGDYIAKLMEKTLEAMKNGEMPDINPDSQTMSSSDLQELMDAIEEMLRTGNMEGAMSALSQLMQALQGMQYALPSGEGQSPFSAPFSGNQELDNALTDLGEIINKQRNLMDETFREGQKGGPDGEQPNGQGGPRAGDPQQGGGGSQSSQSGDLQSGQNSLAEKLDETLKSLDGQGDVPQELERAERAMREAEEALRRGDMDGAVERQQDAIDQLREGTQSLAQDILNDRMRQFGRNGENGEEGPSRDLDPLGRPTARSGPEFGDSVDVPDKSELQRAREILDELRRRAGERDRPEPELDYLERLLPRY